MPQNPPAPVPQETGHSSPVLSGEVREAVEEQRPVVALESTIIAHGLPRPRNLQVARELEELVRKGGAVPATVAVLDGRAHVGLEDSQLARVAEDPGVRKLGHRDLAPALALGASGATTVSATAFLSERAGLRVFATGGLGGVHREWTRTQDESADLRLLARTGITVVCAGVKSILDVPATLQRLETLGVAVLGYGTEHFPGFYLSSSGEPVDWTVRTPEEVAAVMRAREELGGPPTALIVANPVPQEEQLDPAVHDRVLAGALDACRERGITGQAVTPFLLEYLMRETAGASLEANLAAVRGNVRLAARIAVAAAAR
ncbi:MULTISPECIES: pseudouridine-5'-phosphate glycosidase [Streptomyces]|uniref:Pseudouridine-5'-phosphate glycosidase n=1 Tax=Streptomyces glycanivorans TaxID=3033808 RepID=A0ABY9JHQ5_9ACTN|nr:MULTISPECIES: pseudouridine-5'-phosphate glycosidase [unclassified Streptomyces]WSQ80584.1 pseudouridine-5'-phosphate glycosidase [Streptomyces sp. NBC_01213]TXS08387.1 pseudouridine-5'-phosphate glycosidase [Streptomyces sp. wa22]WLQ67163.1 pseudouridine-5'-phosphate glycosidase [Streptomyces sp. Alt3]WSQ87916.1 pseudouridine-5'-phosphate glycosidase [Streptomyces sp. NBC_01212]WSR51316.1 pseudouridine-5'-phosphate glycosidase [Streptomyces sp. NBC_01201]